MKIKIFSCNHVLPKHEISTNLFQTFVSGLTPEQGSRTLSDVSGRNIAERHKFCEMRHQYYIWQNTLAQYDYVGFEHYRRLFYLDPLSLDNLKTRYPKLHNLRGNLAELPLDFITDIHEPGIFGEIHESRSSFNQEDELRIENWIASHDILYTQPMFQNVEENIRNFHGNAFHLWKELEKTLSTSRSFSSLRNYVNSSLPWSGYLNMYIMRSDLFCAYMDEIFPVLLDLDDKYPDAPSRIWGHFTERLLGAFLIQKMVETPMLRCKPIPHLVFDRNACD